MMVPHRVVWSEECWFSPQHLQQADRTTNGCLMCGWPLWCRRTWGILSLDLDLGALQSDQLRVNRFVGILPDGLHLGFEAGIPKAPAARAIGGALSPCLVWT